MRILTKITSTIAYFQACCSDILVRGVEIIRQENDDRPHFNYYEAKTSDFKDFLVFPYFPTQVIMLVNICKEHSGTHCEARSIAFIK